MTPDEIEAVEHEATLATRDGMLFVRNKVGRRYASDNDVALWTGVRLGQLAHKYAENPDWVRLEDVKTAMSGVSWLVSGLSPGVLARWAFPLEQSWGEIGYHHDKSQAAEGNTFGDRIRAGNVYENETHAFEFRTTRDQLSGILFGLSACYALVPNLRGTVRLLVADLMARFEDTNWSLRDHTGSTGGTSAHRVDSAQKLVLRALHHATTGKGSKPWSLWFRFLLLMTAHYNRRFQHVYSHLLNSLDAHSLLLLEDHHREGKRVRCWWKKIWNQMKDDRNPHFEATNVAFGGQPDLSDEAHANLRRLLEHPYDGSYQWNRGPEDWWPTDSSTIGPGLDVLLPYWINRTLKGGTQ